jgi:hypothetical protein
MCLLSLRCDFRPWCVSFVPDTCMHSVMCVFSPWRVFFPCCVSSVPDTSLRSVMCLLSLMCVFCLWCVPSVPDVSSAPDTCLQSVKCVFCPWEFWCVFCPWCVSSVSDVFHLSLTCLLPLILVYGPWCVSSVNWYLSTVRDVCLLSLMLVLCSLCVSPAPDECLLSLILVYVPWCVSSAPSALTLPECVTPSREQFQWHSKKEPDFLLWKETKEEGTRKCHYIQSAYNSSNYLSTKIKTGLAEINVKSFVFSRACCSIETVLARHLMFVLLKGEMSSYGLKTWQEHATFRQGCVTYELAK